LFAAPRHPYSRALLSAIPMPDPRAKRSPMLLRGEMPSALNPPSGCRFHTRCPYAIERCRVERPAPIHDAAGHATACHRVDELPPPDAFLANSHFSPALERLVAAFNKSAEGLPPTGVDSVGSTPTAV
jgi:peptide/nickel transport system ATP-binding protein/oligopeptide transport system ATP-binding protein